MGSSKETNTSCHSQKGYLYSTTLKFEANTYFASAGHYLNYQKIKNKKWILCARYLHQFMTFNSDTKKEVML